jgi:hypothetical protein
MKNLKNLKYNDIQKFNTEQNNMAKVKKKKNWLMYTK